MSEREELIISLLKKVNEATTENLALINIVIDGICGTYWEDKK